MSKNLIVFDVIGEPVVCPRKGSSRFGGQYWLNKEAGEKWEIWERHVTLAIANIMMDLNMDMIPAPNPIKIGMDIWRTKPKSNKLPRPSKRPDFSNFKYDLENSLQGILYEDDGQIVGTVEDDMYWADKNNPAGITIKLLIDFE